MGNPLIKNESISVKVDQDLLPGHSKYFKQSIEFMLEIDKLKHILRTTILMYLSIGKFGGAFLAGEPCEQRSGDV